jgi:hypothetical protein
MISAWGRNDSRSLPRPAVSGAESALGELHGEPRFDALTARVYERL